MLGPWEWCAIIPSATLEALDDHHCDSPLQQVKFALLEFGDADLLAVPLWFPGTDNLSWGWAPVEAEALPPCCQVDAVSTCICVPNHAASELFICTGLLDAASALLTGIISWLQHPSSPLSGLFTSWPGLFRLTQLLAGMSRWPGWTWILLTSIKTFFPPLYDNEPNRIVCIVFICAFYRLLGAASSLKMGGFRRKKAAGSFPAKGHQGQKFKDDPAEVEGLLKAALRSTPR